uniref:Pre-mRNA-processing factor 17 n=1 Tax=Guillardia theta TaxID=55529 RepID=A0A7S4KY98_GUITH|mmetsp:Transcript_33558/g.105669  ORF Transcript_33558/g.105669 Transcript_33558/m.105669 type:complete len:552 (+) Transcript_33558:89-1744(+)
MDAVFGYGSDEDNKSKSQGSLAITVQAAPDVGKADLTSETQKMVANNSKMVTYNPSYEALWTPEAGPSNPYYQNGITPGMRNTLGGFIERTNVADFHFEEQHQTFNTFGFAMDPSAANDSMFGSNIVGDRSAWNLMQGRTVHQATKRDAKKRKLDDSAAEQVLAGLGTAMTSEEAAEMAQDVKAIEEAEKAAKEAAETVKEKAEVSIFEASSIFHGKETKDYQGRTWIDAPTDIKAVEPQSYIPKVSVHTWSGHTKGVQAIRWFPKTGHLLLSASMDCKIKIWDVYNNRKTLRTYMGHQKAVRDICFSTDGRQFASVGYDKVVRYWDTETGTCLKSWRSKGIPYSVKIHPGDDNILAGSSCKNILQWDPRHPNRSSLVQEYIQHLGAVNTVTFIDGNRRVVSTADDKKLFLWEYGIGTAPMKHISEPWMHAMPAVTAAPFDNGNPKYLLCQSLDNQILCYMSGDRFKLNKKKLFVGHTIAGYACQVGVSPDLKYVLSGDGDGRLWLWDWKSAKVYRKFKAHNGVCIGAIWHPVEPSKIATCGWDGLIKFWD